MKVVFKSDKEVLINTTEDDKRILFADLQGAAEFIEVFVNKNMQELHCIIIKMNFNYYYILPTINKVHRSTLDPSYPLLESMPHTEVFFEPIVCVPFMKYYLFHLPKTMGKYLRNNYRIFNEPAALEGEGGHPTFNKNHQTIRPLALLPHHMMIEARYNLHEELVAILRNPFDWLASFFFTNEGCGWENFRNIYPSLTFEGFIKSICTQDKIGMWLSKNIYPLDEGLTSPLFDENRTLKVKNFIFFEHYHAGMDALGITRRVENYWLPFKNKKLNELKESSVGSDYRSHYNDHMKQLVYDKFKFDLDFGGYNFDGLTHEAVAIVRGKLKLNEKY